jgi:hypothetical protein
MYGPPRPCKVLGHDDGELRECIRPLASGIMVRARARFFARAYETPIDCLVILAPDFAALHKRLRLLPRLVELVLCTSQRDNGRGQREQVPAYSMCIRTTFIVCIRRGEITGAVSRGTLPYLRHRRAREPIVHPFRRFWRAQGLPYVLAPRVLSRQEWIEQYSGDKGPGEDDP